DFADVFTTGPELEQLSRRGAVHRAANAGARVDEEMSFRVDGDAGDFAEIHRRRKLQEVDVTVEADFRNSLRLHDAGDKTQQDGCAHGLLELPEPDVAITNGIAVVLQHQRQFVRVVYVLRASHVRRGS